MLVLGLETLLTAEVSVLVSSWLEGPGNNTASSTVPAVVCPRRPGHPARQSARQCRRDGGGGGGRPRHGHERGTGDAGVGCRQPADPGRQGAHPRPPRDHVVDAETTQRHANELLHALPAPARSPPQLNRVRRVVIAHLQWARPSTCIGCATCSRRTAVRPVENARRPRLWQSSSVRSPVSIEHLRRLLTYLLASLTREIPSRWYR